MADAVAGAEPAAAGDIDALLAAVAVRFDAADATPRRLFHGRGHCFEGLADVVLERFGDVLLLTLHGPRPEAWLQALALALRELPGAATAIRTLLVQQRDVAGAPSRVLWGVAPGEFEVCEARLRYLVRPGVHQNPGLFLDMAGARRWVQSVAADARVLNLFAYTCAFSLAALAGGAAQVLNVDMSDAALRTGRRQHELNGFEPRRVTLLAHDVLRSWSKLQRLGPWDLVIVDPPTLQRGSFDAARQYGSIVRRLPRLCAPGGRALLCLNSPFLPGAFLAEQMAAQAPDFSFDEALTAGPDFPELDADRGLKMQVWRAP